MPRKTEPRPFTLDEAFNVLTNDELRALVALLPEKAEGTRKAAFTNAIERWLTGDRLRQLWDKLGEVEQQAVAEAVYHSEGRFDPDRFKAKYGALPVFGTKTDSWRYQQDPALIRLFIYSDTRWTYVPAAVPIELRERLRAFVPRPLAAILPTIDELPETIEREDREYELADDDEGITVYAKGGVYIMPRKPPKVHSTIHQILLTRRDTEREAQQDLLTVLRLIDQGKVQVSDKTNQPSSATEEMLAALLRNGDYYELPAKPAKGEQEIGPIKAFAWPLLVQVGKLAELNGKKLALTKAGRAALTADPSQTLKLLWERWLKSKLLDELNRIDIIKGQHGQGKRTLTAVEGRRAALAQALTHCPAGSWIKLDEFFRYLRAASLDFTVSREPVFLYVESQEHGHLAGYGSDVEWLALQARYSLCFLFEYAATLGLLDVAYVNPRQARRDFKQMWGIEDLDFLSRYDGLMYFRLNPFGAYCLGLVDSYTPSAIAAKASLTVLPSLQVNVSGAPLSLDEALLLETWAEKETESSWRLDRDKMLTALERGGNLAELREFLAARDEQELPDTVIAVFNTTERNARALRQKGAALLIECADAELAELLATHERTKKLCLRAGEKHIVVKETDEVAFRKAAHVLGYGMPHV